MKLNTCNVFHWLASDLYRVFAVNPIVYTQKIKEKEKSPILAVEIQEN
jgi:hypothetical protein